MAEGGLNLNLSGAKEMTFDPVPSGWYDATIFEIKVGEQERDTAKLKKGTKYINVQFKLDPEDERTNGQDRRVFRRYFIVDNKYDKEAKAKMDGMVYGFLKAAGESEEQLRSGDYDLAAVLEDLQGRSIRVRVKLVPERENEDTGEMYDAKNDVVGVKPIGDREAVDSLLS